MFTVACGAFSGIKVKAALSDPLQLRLFAEGRGADSRGSVLTQRHLPTVSWQVMRPSSQLPPLLKAQHTWPVCWNTVSKLQLHMHIYVHACIYVCMYCACIYVCIHACVYRCMHMLPVYTETITLPLSCIPGFI